MTKNTPAPLRVQALFRQLSNSAANLNDASDDLCAAISVLDEGLQKLNLGISAWVTITGGDNPQNGEYWSRDLGYAKIGGAWGIALRDITGNLDDPEEKEHGEAWLFNNAPRWMRIEGVARIPELLETLIKQVEATTKKITQRTLEAMELAAAIGSASAQPDESVTVQKGSAETKIPAADPPERPESLNNTRFFIEDSTGRITRKAK